MKGGRREGEREGEERDDCCMVLYVKIKEVGVARVLIRRSKARRREVLC